MLVRSMHAQEPEGGVVGVGTPTTPPLATGLSMHAVFNHA